VAVISGGKALEARLREIAKGVTKKATLRVGFLEGATYPDGTSVPIVAAIQEFGSPSQGIPPRPFFRRMIAAKASTWGDATAKLLAQNDYDAERTLGLVGMGIKGQLQQSIRDLTDPPLAPATVAAKGFDKPLVDTGHMLNSVDFEVKT
jgi:hypothetical protein